MKWAIISEIGFTVEKLSIFSENATNEQAEACAFYCTFFQSFGTSSQKAGVKQDR